MTNVLEVIHSAVRDRRDDAAVDPLAPEGEPTSFSRLWSLTDRFARGLRDRDIGPGDAVGVRLSDPTAFLVATYGTLRNGSVPVTLPATDDDGAIRRALEATDAVAIAVDGHSPTSICAPIPDLRLAITVDSDAFLGIDYEAFLDNDGLKRAARTGVALTPRDDGETGLIAFLDRDESPLAVTYSHRQLRGATALGRTCPDDRDVDAHLGALPLADPIGLWYGATATLAAGGTYRPLPSWDPSLAGDALEAVDRAYVTRDQYETLRSAGVDPSHDALVVVESPAAASDDPDGPIRLRGRPETGLTHVGPATDGEGPGTPLPGVDARTLADGELAVASPATMTAYDGRPELTAATVERDGDTRWVRTGVHVGGRSETARPAQWP